MNVFNRFRGSGGGAKVPKIFGDGSDGDLIIGAGQTVTLPVVQAHKDVIIKQYSSINIAAGGTLITANSNCGLIIKCKGACTINGAITQSGKGAFNNPQLTYEYPAELICGDGGAGAYGQTPSHSGGGWYSSGAAGGTGANKRVYGGGMGGGGGGGGAASTVSASTSTIASAKKGNDALNTIIAEGGAGCTFKRDAGTSGSYTADGGKGGAGAFGGGIVCLYIGGDYKNAGLINCSGVAGNGGGYGYAPSGSSLIAGVGGQGGGGGGGAIYICYNAEYLNTGTLNVNGGVGGAAGRIGTITTKKYEKGQTV